jgi:hypothetical protein
MDAFDTALSPVHMQTTMLEIDLRPSKLTEFGSA